MKLKLNDVPVLKEICSCIDAKYYNRVRLALNRLGSPLRIELINLRGLDIYLDNDKWVCIDRTMNDLPVFAWTDFKTRERQGIYEPLSCKLRFYHNHADLICTTVLDLVHRNLDLRLKQIRSDQPACLCHLF